MDELIPSIAEILSGWGLGDLAAPAARAAALVWLALLAWLANFVAKRILLRSVLAVVRRSETTWDDALVRSGFFTRLSHVAPALVVDVLGEGVFAAEAGLRAVLATAVDVYLVAIGLGILFALLDAIVAMTRGTAIGARVPFNGFAQAAKLVASIVGGILILSALLGKSPVLLFSGLGALTAVLLLVFRDALLGFVAGIMIATNRLVQVGDWIEMPKAGADGDVVDVSLTTVKVQNWDKTYTTIPAYSLISESFKNWRGMQESGGRRIKRSILVDLSTIAFADEEQLARWGRIRLLQAYLEAKRVDIAADNERRRAAGLDPSVLGNGRRLTNIGTFRAYCVAYLREHPRVHQQMTFLVRQLAPGEHGLPIEIYVFTNDIRWTEYESIQADIFDHLLAMVPQFGLRVFQAPTGADWRALRG